MEILLFLSILLYLSSTGAYLAYLFTQKKPFHRWGLILIAAGFACHTALILLGFAGTGRFPVGNLRETLSLAAWTVAGVFLVVHHRFNLRVLGTFAAPLAAVLMGIASPLPREPAQVAIIFNNFWIIFHVVVIFIGNAAFALACGVGVLYLLQENAIKTKSPGFFFRRLPSLDLLDTTGYACIVVGFTALTVGLISGFVYAKIVWGRFWGWDPKEVWAFIMWLFYAALLHERLTVGWRGRKAAIMSIIGFGVLLFTFLGVNFLMEGHHRPFTRW